MTAKRPFAAVNGDHYLPDATYYEGIDHQKDVPLVPFGASYRPEDFETEAAAIRHGEWWASRGDGRPRDGWRGVPWDEFTVEYEP